MWFGHITSDTDFGNVDFSWITDTSTLFLVLLMIVSEPANKMEDYFMIAIYDFCFILLTNSNSNLLQFSSLLCRWYMRLFQLLTRLTADVEDSSYRLYPSTMLCMTWPIKRPFSIYCGLRWPSTPICESQSIIPSGISVFILILL